MARGWESKAVEAQIETFEDSGRSRPAARLSPAQIHAMREKDGLLLSRTRVLHDIEGCRNPRYKQILSETLAFLDQKLAQLN